MQQIITAKLKLHTTAEQFQALRATQLAYRDALNFVSRYSFEHGKISNQVHLRDETYYKIRATYHLTAQMATNVPRQVGTTYKTLWTKVKQNKATRKAGLTQKPYKGLDKPPKYVSPTLMYNYQRDYSLKPESQVSILTLQGRVIVPYTRNAYQCCWGRCRYTLSCRHSYNQGRSFFPLWEEGRSQSKSLCETEKASAKERHAFCYQATGYHERAGETVESRRQSPQQGLALCLSELPLYAPC